MSTEKVSDAPAHGTPPNLAAGQQGDVSRKTIVLLLVLTIFVSAFGTWMVLQATNSTSTAQPSAAPGGPTVGQVAVNIVRPPAPKTGGAMGYVTLNIRNSSEAHAP